MQVAPAKREIAAVERTLQSMMGDLEKFRNKYKSNPGKAKEANNVIDEPYFDIPLDQVMILLVKKLIQ